MAETDKAEEKGQDGCVSRILLGYYYCRRSVFVTDVMNGTKDWGEKWALVREKANKHVVSAPATSHHKLGAVL